MTSFTGNDITVEEVKSLIEVRILMAAARVEATRDRAGMSASTWAARAIGNVLKALLADIESYDLEDNQGATITQPGHRAR